MSSTVLYMSMSLDGFIAGPNEIPDNGLGDGGHRLHEWSFPGGGDDLEAAVARLRGVNRPDLRRVYVYGGRGSRTWNLRARGRLGRRPSRRRAHLHPQQTRHPPGRPNGLPCTM